MWRKSCRETDSTGHIAARSLVISDIQAHQSMYSTGAALNHWVNWIVLWMSASLSP